LLRFQLLLHVTSNWISAGDWIKVSGRQQLETEDIKEKEGNENRDNWI